MSDPFFDDVKELLDKEKGDERILKQILRACENNEVISNYERNYVRKLTEKYLGRSPIANDTFSVEKTSSPDVVSEPQLSQPQILQKVTQRKSNSKNATIMLGVGGAALISIIIIVIISTQISDVLPNSDVSKPSIITPASIDTDSTSYKTKDIISISGKLTAGTVALTIENPSGSLIWSEQVKTKNDGSFSTLVIAGGPGWEQSGSYTIKVQTDSETDSKVFSFTA